MPKITPDTYGTSHTSQTAMLNRWKPLIAFSSLRANAKVAHAACKAMSTMASMPVIPWKSNRNILPAIFPMAAVPAESQTKPAQKKTSHAGDSLPLIFSPQTPIE